MIDLMDSLYEQRNNIRKILYKICGIDRYTNKSDIILIYLSDIFVIAVLGHV